MNASRKDARRLAAMQATMERTLRHVFSLAVCLQRARAAHVSYEEAATRLFTSGRTDEEIIAGVNDRLVRLELDDFVRSGAMLAFYVATLYTVIEGWRKWHFVDARVDALLADKERVRRLKEYRHTVFHASEFDHKDMIAWAELSSNAEWTSQLTTALMGALRDWRENLEQRMATHLRASLRQSPE